LIEKACFSQVVKKMALCRRKGESLMSFVRFKQTMEIVPQNPQIEPKKSEVIVAEVNYDSISPLFSTHLPGVAYFCRVRMSDVVDTARCIPMFRMAEKISGKRERKLTI
jgi:hypothetical protein